MKSTGVIWTVKAGLQASAAYVQELIKHNNTAFGGTLVDAKAGVIDVTKQDTALTLTTWADIEQNFKDYPRVFWACTTDKGISEDNVQPFFPVETDAGPLIACFLTGDFSKHAEKDSVHTAEFHAYHKRVKPKIQKIWDNCLTGENLDSAKLVKELNDPVFRDDMEDIWVENGSITLVLFTGDIIGYHDQDHYAEFPWGTTTNNYGYTETPAAPAPKVEEKKPSALMSFRRKTTADAAPITTPAAPAGEPVSPAPGPVQPEQPATQPVPQPQKQEPTVKAGEGEGRWVQCPPNINGKAEMKRYYERELGHCPNGYKKKPRIWKPADTSGSAAVADTGTASAQGGEVISFRRAKGQEKTVASVEPVKAPVAETAKGPTNVSSETGLPVLTAAQKKELADFLEKAQMPTAYVDGSKELLAPAVLDQAEQELPDFAEQSGGKIKSIRDTFGWRYPNLVNLAYTSPEGVALLAIGYRTAMFKNMKQNGTLNQPAKPAEDAKPAETKQTGNLSFRRKA